MYKKTIHNSLSLAIGLIVSGHSMAANESENVQEILVEGHQRDYYTDEAKSALGLNLELLKTPAAVSVISQDILKDQQVNNVDDALRNVAGVTKFKTGNGGEEKFSIRGFDASQSIYKDGARINNPLNASNIPSTETANIQRIEVLKGPAALLYGQGEPGGIINYITKHPQFERYGYLEVLAGSDDFKKVEADITGGVGNSDTLAFRVVGTYEDSGSFRNEVFRERLLVNPTMSFVPSESTQILIGYEYIDDNYTQDRGQVLDGNNEDGYYYSDRLNSEQFFGIPDWNRHTTAESQRLYSSVKHDFSDAWRVELNYSRTNNDKVNFDSSPTVFPAGQGLPELTIVGPEGSPVSNLVPIGPRKSDGEGTAEQFKINSFIDFSDGFNFEHQILASYTHEEFSTESTSFRGDQVVFFNVADGEYFDDPTSDVLPESEEIRINENLVFGMRNRGFSLNQDFEEQGVNVLDYIRFNQQWAWLIGGRYSEYQDNLNSGFEDDNFSMRTGIVFTPRDPLSFYLSYAEGYTSSQGRTKENGEHIDPETSLSLEFGAKLQLMDERLLLTGSVYDIDKEDIAYVTNPEDSGTLFFDNIGAINSKGFEVELVGYLTEQWRIQAGYAYMDAEITEGGQDNFGNEFPEGNELPGIAENNFNLFTFYEFSVADGNFGLGGGLFSQSDIYASLENRAEYDGWTQLDLAMYYKRDAWKAQLNVRNITDEEYNTTQGFISSDRFAAGRVGTAAPMSVIGSIAYEF